MKLYLIVLFSVANINLFAQKIFLEYDSIPLSKPKALKNLYQIDHPLLNEISISGKAPKAASDIPKKFWGNFTGGALTLFTGITTSSSEETIWFTENELTANNIEYSWKIHFYFPGQYEKTRERVKNDDGSTSVSTEKVIYVDWSKGGDGLIFEKSDTVGRFALMTNFVSEKEILNWLSRIDAERPLDPSQRNPYNIIPMNYNFAVTGILHGKNFSVISSGKIFRSVIFIENKPVAIFQGDSNQVVLSKKNRPPIYLLLDKPSDIDHADLFRLSMLIRLLTKSISVDYYEK